jgi:hypothetical protein
MQQIEFHAGTILDMNSYDDDYEENILLGYYIV